MTEKRNDSPDKVRISTCTFADALLGETYGYDVQVLDEQATLQDFLCALSAYAQKKFADCKGCDGCCHERAPLISLDIPALASLLPPDPFPAHQVCRAFAKVSVDADGVSDIVLRRDEQSCCGCLHLPGKFCTIHPQRPFVCRSHFCPPKTQRVDWLRQEIVNMGENQLTHMLLAEEAAGAPPLDIGLLNRLLDTADYPPTPLQGLEQYRQARIRALVSPELWATLRQ
ncbi:MAG: hypothetical protein K6B40_05710 [Firmicutes bacterium]|nr:hypothetical protein [Bacillota bacterium]